MRLFGEYVGMAFQIKDDIFDYGSGTEIGKPTGNDIREQKLTLPMIYTLNNAPQREVKELRNIIRNKYDQTKEVRRAIEIVKNNGGIAYADEKMRYFAEKAKDMLIHFEENEAKKSLLGLVNYTMERRK
jgi:octaprenyl-diphosphate synthase